MAEGTIISFAQKLGLLVLEEYKFLKGVEEQVMYLRDEFEWITSFLTDAAVQRSTNARVDIWVTQIRDIAYDAEDVLDIFIHKRKQQQERKIRRVINCRGQLSTLHKLGNQINSINRRIERISSYKSKYAIDKLEDKDSLGKDVGLTKRRTLDVEADDVVGFESQSKTVANMLLQEEDLSQPHVVSIVGMPGAGKSTLVLKVYNDVKKENKFDSFAWIYVSQEFKSESLLKSIMDQNSRKEDNPSKEGNPRKEDNPSNEGNPRKEEDMGRLLVVFDDVWRVQDWDELHKNVLKIIRSTEIRVLLTSRSHEVATYANSRIHGIGKLEEEKGLELLKKKVFHEKDFPNELKELGKQIVDKCHDLPLAIVVLGGLLSTKQKTIDVWTKVLNSASWQLLQGSTECFEVVALSYDNLPNFLKPCFLYLGLFPEDTSIDCEDLIQLWTAEGFIQERGGEAMEDVGEDYLEELIQRNLIQVENRKLNGSIRTCRIHDLLREFAISKGRRDKFLDILGNKGKANCPSMSHRLAVYLTKEGSEGAEIPKSSSSLNNLRSMLCFEGAEIPKSSSFLNNPLSRLRFDMLSTVRLLEDKSFYKRLKLLRVLDLRGVTRNLKSLPNEIGKLVLLKYFNLQGAVKLKRLPSSIRNLQNLQSLNITATQIYGIPWFVWKLEELRHFYFTILYKPRICKIIEDYCHCGAPQIGRLRNLRTLSARGGNWICNDFSQLTNLRKLRIHGVNMERYGAALSNSIPKFIYLRELEIYWYDEGKLQFPDSFSQLVQLYKVTLFGATEKLPTDPHAFPPNLMELYLGETCLNEEEGNSLMKTLAALKNLKRLTLHYGTFLGKQMVFPALMGFSNLISLSLFQLEYLEEWKVEERSLPKLKSLQLVGLRSLRELPDGLRQVTTLQEFVLGYMPQKIEDTIKKKRGR